MNTSGEAARRLVRRRVEISIAASPFGGISIPQTKTTQQVGNNHVFIHVSYVLYLASVFLT